MIFNTLSGHYSIGRSSYLVKVTEQGNGALVFSKEIDVGIINLHAKDSITIHPDGRIEGEQIHWNGKNGEMVLLKRGKSLNPEMVGLFQELYQGLKARDEHWGSHGGLEQRSADEICAAIDKVQKNEIKLTAIEGDAVGRRR